MATTTSGLTSISGLSSGIDTSSLITSLMRVAAGPQTLLKSKLTSTNSALTALQTVNTQMASLATAATALTKPAAYAALAASSSSTATTTTTSSTATPGSLTFDVTQLAAAHSVIGPASSATSSSGSQTVTITHGTGAWATTTSFPATSDSPADLAAAINAGDTALSATVVMSNDGTARLVVSSRTTGDASRFTVDVGGSSYGDQLTQGRDAKLQLGNGDFVTSATNTFTALMTGVDVTVSKVETGTTVSVATDTSGVTKSVQALVDQLNTVVGTIAVNTAAKPASSTGSSVSTNALTGQNQVVSLRTTLLSQVSGALGNLDPAAAGISVDRSGNVTFDSAVFGKLMASDPTRAQAVVSALAGEVATTAKQASDPYEGTVSLMISGRKTEASALTDAIEDWDDRLSARAAALKAQFAAMETALSALNTQASALSAALSSLSSSSS